MKTLFIKYKRVLRFLAVFFGCYLLGAFFYGQYLRVASQSPGVSEYYPDPITHLVAKQSVYLIQAFGYETQLQAHPTEPAMYVAIEGRNVARVVEGCNALSVMILFAAFVVAFWQRPKPTLLFLFAGATLIYAVNIFRIALFIISLHRYPQYRDFLHDIAFPGVIYGLVFLLWIAWVRRLPTQKQASNAS